MSDNSEPALRSTEPLPGLLNEKLFTFTVTVKAKSARLDELDQGVLVDNINAYLAAVDICEFEVDGETDEFWSPNGEDITDFTIEIFSVDTVTSVKDA